jgi:ATP-dependent Lon protease
MISSLKNSLKDQIQFSLILFTGLFAGSIFTLINIKLWEQGDVTFADIGGMLAGVGTIGLLWTAIAATDGWKKQQKLANKYKRLDEYYDQCTDAFNNLHSWKNATAIHNKLQSHSNEGSPATLEILKASLDSSLTNMNRTLDQYLKAKHRLDRTITKLNKDFEKQDIMEKVLLAFKKCASNNSEDFIIKDTFNQLHDEYHRAYDVLYNSIEMI